VRTSEGRKNKRRKTKVKAAPLAGGLKEKISGSRRRGGGLAPDAKKGRGKPGLIKNPMDFREVT